MCKGEFLVGDLPGPAGAGPLADGLSDEQVESSLRELQRLSSRVEARRAELVALADRRGIPRRRGFASTTAWLMAISGDPAAVCRSRLAVAAALEEMPETREAFAAGAVSESRVRLLAQAQALAPEQFSRDEASLVAQAASVPSPWLPQVLSAWRRSTDPEGAETDTERAFARRTLHISPAWSGMVHLHGDLDPESGLIVLNAVHTLSEPAALDPADTRTPAQCRADALVEICRRHLDGNPGSGRQRPQLTVTISGDTLRKGTGSVDTEAGPISVQAVRRLACDASLSPVTTHRDGAPLTAGHTRRVVSPPLRKALDLRDRGCTHPGCDIPARWCDAHHIIHWAEGGKTDLANPSI